MKTLKQFEEWITGQLQDAKNLHAKYAEELHEAFDNEEPTDVILALDEDATKAFHAIQSLRECLMLIESFKQSK